MSNSAIQGLGAPDPIQTTETQGNANLGKDEFVRLLMTQLAHQDPTAPQDSQQFIAQLAQFAHVELAQTSNARLEALLVAQAANNQTATATLVGKEVSFIADEVKLSEGQHPKLEMSLAEEAQTLTVTLKGKDGKEHKQTLNGPHVGTVEYEIPEAVRKELGDSITIDVVAAKADGGNVDVTTRVRARVTGVTFVEGFPQLLVGEDEVVSLADVLEIYEASNP